MLTRVHFDDGEDKLIIENVQDVEDVLEANKREQTEDHRGYTPSRNMRKVASIPNVVAYDLMKKGIWNDPVAMKKWLNDPDNRYFRTSEGRV